jgi:molecular chaperone GrpE (heat shock protein)
VSKGDPSETFRQATRLAEDRIAEVTAAMNAFKTDNEAFRDRLEGQLSEKYEKRREHLLLSAVQTLEAMDRAIEAARNSDAAESLISGVMLVRTQLFRILQEEGLERVSVLGLPFDRRSAEAVQRRPVTDSDQDGLVIEELQGGHQLRGHIIRRAKVVVGEFVDEAAAATAAMPAVAGEGAPIEPTVAMPVRPETVAKKDPDETPEEPIVVEDWNEPTHPGTPSTFLVLPAATLVAPSAKVEEEDDSASATMVLGDEAAMFVRPPARVAAAGGVASASGPPSSARGTGAGPRPPVRPGTTGYPPPRVRTGPVPPTPLRDRSPVYEEVPGRPSEPAVPPPATPTHPGVATAGPAGGGRRLSIGLVVVAVALLTAVVIGWWVLGRRPKPPEAGGGQVASTTQPDGGRSAATQPDGGRSAATPLAASPVAVAPPPVIPEEVTVVRPSTGEAPALPTPAPAAVAPPKATPRPVAAAPATARPTAPPPAAPVNPIPALMSQADQAMTAKRYNEAISKFGEVLKIEPQNAEAATGKLRAQGERASLGRYFLTAVTMSEGKASGGGIKGFDGGSVVKSQCECALTYEVTPANPAQGDPYTVSIFLRNDSKKDIKPQSITASVTVNGSSSNRPVSLATREIRRGQKTLVGRLEDVWKLGTTSWSMEGAITAGGNAYRAQLTWELRVPSGQ